MLLGLFLKLIGSHLKHLNDLVEEIRILPQSRSTGDFQRLFLIFCPDFIQYSRRVLKCVFIELWVAFEVKLRYVRICGLNHVLFVVLGCGSISRSVRVLRILYLENFQILLSSSIVMLSSSPIIIKFSSDFPVSLFNVGLHHERVLKKLWPSKSLIRSLI